MGGLKAYDMSRKGGPAAGEQLLQQQTLENAHHPQYV
jgi:hypothetical protein